MNFVNGLVIKNALEFRSGEFIIYDTTEVLYSSNSRNKIYSNGASELYK